MRFLADAGVSPATIEFLRGLGHDAIHVRDIGLHRAADREIVDLARAESRYVLTFDLDFGEILALGVLDGPSVVIFRLSDERPASVNGRLAVVIRERSDDLASGSLVLIEDDRYRVRRLPIGRH